MAESQRPQRTMTLAIQRFDRTMALLSRAVPIRDMYVMHAPPTTSVEGLVRGTFDAAELPVARYMFLRDRGEPITAIPVFTDRLFIQQYVYTRPNTGIRSPADLRGRRVLVPQYFMTACIWHRGLLKDEYGISPQEIEWHTTGPEREGMRIPEDVKVVTTPAPNMGVGLLLDGTVDCLMLESTPLVPLEHRHQIVRVHQDVGLLQREFYRKTGFHIAVHLIGVRRAALEERPELQEELCEAFDQAKALAYRALQNERLTSLPLMRTYLDETRALFGDDPWPYGLERNRAELDQVLAYAHDQGLTQRRLSPQEIFDQPAQEFKFQAQMPEGSSPWSFPSLA